MIKMKKLKIISIILMFITFLFIYQNSAYCMNIEEVKVASDITVDDIFGEADNFIKKGENEIKANNINTDALGETSNFLYKLLLGVGIITAVAVGIVLGIKYMVGSLEVKADLKQVLLGYAISCLVVFATFIIWKIAVNILSNI